MSRFAVVICFTLCALAFPLLFGGCQLNRLGGAAAQRESLADDVYVQRARNMRWSDGTTQHPVTPVAYHAPATDVVPPPSNDATAQPIGPPAAGQYSPAALKSRSRPFDSPSRRPSQRSNCSGFG
jgi:hypothetical protein